MPLYAITGSATEDGRPIYRTAAGSWSSAVSEARLLDDDAETAQQLEAARREQRLVCDPYTIEVEREGETVVPLRLKERIRAAGPTVSWGPDAQGA